MKYETMYIFPDAATCELSKMSAAFGDKVRKVTTLTIPKVYNGYRVIIVNFYNSPIFKKNKSLIERIERVRIPNTVRQIASHCFRDFRNLKEIEFYGENSYGEEVSELRSIGSTAFEGLSGLESFPFDKCPNLFEINYTAFNKCNLESVDLSGTKVETLFSHCFQLNKIKVAKFPPTLKNVGCEAFNKNLLEELDFSMCNDSLHLDRKCFSCNMLNKVSYPIFGCKVDSTAFDDNRFAMIEQKNDLFV